MERAAIPLAVVALGLLAACSAGSGMSAAARQPAPKPEAAKPAPTTMSSLPDNAVDPSVAGQIVNAGGAIQGGECGGATTDDAGVQVPPALLGTAKFLGPASAST